MSLGSLESRAPVHSTKEAGLSRITKHAQDHTNATTSHVSGYHNGAFSSFEFVQHPITFILLLITVNRKTRPAVLSEELAARQYLMI